MMVLRRVLKALPYRTDKQGGADSEEGVIPENYQLELPPVVKQVFGAMLGLGIFMFALFFYFYSRGEANVTKGHLIFAAVVALCGAVVLAFAYRWKVIVEGEMVTIQNIFGVKRTFPKSDIERIEINRKGSMELYVAGKKVKQIDGIITNYELFMEDMERIGKL